MLRGWVALTGTPGVGKSTLAEAVRLRGVSSVDVGRFAHDFDLVEGVDPRRTSAIVDPRRVAPTLRRVTQAEHVLLLDGHWSHDVPGVTAAIVLRLDPRQLEARLRRRGWPEPKIRENVEAEAVDLILQEAVARLGTRRVFELDTTHRSPDELRLDLAAVLRGSRRDAARFRPGHVDWSAHLLDRA